MGCIGMCRCEGYGFQAVYSWTGYIIPKVSPPWGNESLALRDNAVTLAHLSRSSLIQPKTSYFDPQKFVEIPCQSLSNPKSLNVTNAGFSSCEL